MNVADSPKSILKKKSQFDREADSYLRVKPVKSIRFSLDSNKISSKSSLAPSNISLDPKIIKSKKDQNKNEKKRRRRNNTSRNVGEETEPFPTESIHNCSKSKKGFLEGHGDEKEKNNNEKNKEIQPEGNKGDSLIVRSTEEVKKGKEEAKEVEETAVEKPKVEKEMEKKGKKKRRRRRRRKQKPRESFEW